MGEGGTERLDWLKETRLLILELIERTDSGLPCLSRTGDEHLRDAIEASLEQQRALLAKLSGRIALESGAIAG